MSEAGTQDTCQLRRWGKVIKFAEIKPE